MSKMSDMAMTIEELRNAAAERLADLMPEAADIGKLRMQGLSDEAIAKSIGIPRTTFLSRIKAAKKQLEKEYPDFF